MAQIVVSKTAGLTAIHPKAADAEAFARLARAGFPGSAFSASIGGVSVTIDQQSIAAGARLAGESAALGRAAANALQGISLLQTADRALDEISQRLAALESVAKDASSASTALSMAERMMLDVAFQTLVADVDDIAEAATFDGTALLQGGSGPGGALQVIVKAGTGATAADDITIGLEAATISALSPGLQAADLRSQAGAAAALTAVQAARDALDERRGAVSGGIVRLASAANGAAAQSAILDQAGRDVAAPDVSIDFSRLLADQVAEEGGLNLSRGTTELLQGLLLRLGAGTDESGRKDPPSPRPEPDSDPAV